jgi:hypothetical protein
MEHQLDATITVLLISKISSTCFRLILEINKTVTVASSWCSILLYLQYCILKNESNEVQGLVKLGSNLAAEINTA